MNRHSSSNSCYGVDRTQLLLQEETAMQNKGLFSVMDSVHPSCGDMKAAEVERIVRKTLLQMQDLCRFVDVENVLRFAVPKVLYDLHAFERLTLEVQEMKEALNSYIHHFKAMGKDLAEIFLDLHNIYTKLDQLDRNMPRRSREKREKYLKRLREAENFLENAKHFIVKQKTPTPTPTVTPTATPTATPTSSTHKQRKRDRLGDVTRQTRSAERRAFLTNMIMVKKSDFSMELNRNKDFYMEAERVLRKKYCNKHGVP
ncbi:uncharacterized protein LOC6576366 [Drosophila mojavensis]|uniref:Uncharacterized protein n=1 Tax=Drosophila mojavensis TaxID=7230 RepID=B4KE54_DROMO|nr:uncharacterized protein LOC6576366 [Drosophila mojavensis]EDW11799.1 uncharacterized protein Dmoj_GI13161 [Drosophila mojavensis]